MIRRLSLIGTVALLAGGGADPGAAQDIDLRPGTARTVELVAVYLGATSCGPCRAEATKQAVREVLAAAEERAIERHFRFQAVGAALDEDIGEGMALLESTAEFDQVIVGGSWSNAAAVEFIWSNEEVLAAIPQVVILTRSLDKRVQQREAASSHVFVQLQGENQMRAWLDAGGVVF